MNLVEKLTTVEMQGAQHAIFLFTTIVEASHSTKRCAAKAFLRVLLRVHPELYFGFSCISSQADCSLLADAEKTKSTTADGFINLTYNPSQEAVDSILLAGSLIPRIFFTEKGKPPLLKQNDFFTFIYSLGFYISLAGHSYEYNNIAVLLKVLDKHVPVECNAARRFIADNYSTLRTTLTAYM